MYKQVTTSLTSPVLCKMETVITSLEDWGKAINEMMYTKSLLNPKLISRMSIVKTPSF